MEMRRKGFLHVRGFYSDTRRRRNPLLHPRPRNITRSSWNPPQCRHPRPVVAILHARRKDWGWVYIYTDGRRSLLTLPGRMCFWEVIRRGVGLLRGRLFMLIWMGRSLGGRRFRKQQARRNSGRGKMTLLSESTLYAAHNNIIILDPRAPTLLPLPFEIRSTLSVV